jgi:hypothetical protein
VTVLSTAEVAFSMSLDRAVYDTNGIPVMNARLTLRSTMAQPLDLTFPSGQRYDLIVRNDRGQEVARWSDGKAFTLIFGTEKFGPGERNYMVQLPLEDKQNKRLPSGKYVAEGFLATEGEFKPYVARVGFEIVPEAAPAQP